MRLTVLQSTLSVLVAATVLTIGLEGASASSAPLRSAVPQMKMVPVRHHPLNDVGERLMQSMATMNRDMGAAPMSGDSDHDFAEMMIPHHQGAVEMAKVELQYGKDPVLRRFAQEVVATQTQEIVLMRRRLAQLPTSQIKAGMGERPLRIVPHVDPSDRVYTADQVSNTVSVISPATNRLLGVIRLGDPVPQSLSPLYRGQLLVHGLGFSPDGRTLVVVSIGSNSVTFIETASNRVKGRIYVGRSPHEAFFTPDGREVWCAIRGEDYVSVIDPVRFKETRRIYTGNGPAMILFSPDGKYAYVPSSFVPVMSIVDVRRHRVIARVKQFSPFSPNLAVSRDGRQVWITLKDTGKTQVFSALPPFKLISTLDTGPISNHVTLVDNAQGHFAYVSVGGLNEVKVYRRGPVPILVKRIPTGDLPHGIWASPNGSRVYVGLENGDAVQVIDALKNSIISTIPVGQLPQALVYVAGAAPKPNRSNLTPLGIAGQASHLNLGGKACQGNVVVNSLGLVDSLQLSATGLKPGNVYELQLVDRLTAPETKPVGLIRFNANASGAGLAQAIGPVRTAVTSGGSDSNPRRYLRVIETATGNVVLSQVE